MREGFTTGSCAAAAAKAAAYMLLSGREKKNISILTPGGRTFESELLDIRREKNSVSCAVRKDGGDDPDVTTGAMIYAKVSISEDETERNMTVKNVRPEAGIMPKKKAVMIEGGEGVGRVTMPGLDQPVGNAAINSVPRRMITKEVTEVMELYDFEGLLSVLIYVPGGEEIAKKTFNQRLGIEGGISILGTSGIVEPMSEKAITDTIRLELGQKRELGAENIVITPGNYGADFIRDTYGFDIDLAVKCSNHIGETIEMAADCGYKNMLLCGHIGKLIKVAGGIMNTHSRVADCRMELMAVIAFEAGIYAEQVSAILKCVSTDAAYAIVRNTGKESLFADRMMQRIEGHLSHRAAGRIKTECMVFSNVYGIIGMTEGAERMLKNPKT